MIKKIIAYNALILLVAYVTLEIFSPYLFKNFWSSPFLTPFVPETLRIYIQSSKKNLIPENYIAVAGDSNAVGLGDWLQAEMDKPQAQYQATHVLHQKLGRDIVSFGSSGAGSIRAYVGEPLSLLALAKKPLFYKMPEPQVMLLYFYEGNDLADNLEYLAASNQCVAAYDAQKMDDAAYFDEYVQRIAFHDNEFKLKAEQFGLLDNFNVAGFARKLYAARQNRQTASLTNYYQCSPYAWFGRTSVKKPGAINYASINGEVVKIPDRLQAPPLDMTEPQMQQALFSFERSLAIVQAALPNTKMAVVYIPSVLSTYQLASEQASIQPFIDKKIHAVESQAIYDLSNTLRRNIEQLTVAQDILFFDSTDYLQAVAKTEMIHGPNDWNHFNRRGYETLAEALALFIRQNDL